MRRIIERVVTVVTTTTWTISWEKESADPDVLAASTSETGADSFETRKTSEHASYPYLSEDERKSKP